MTQASAECKSKMTHEITSSDRPLPSLEEARVLAAPLFARLTELGIETTTVWHDPVFTVGESDALYERIDGAHTKNLFLKDKKGRLWLISARQDTVIDLKRAPSLIGSDRLSFGNEVLMWETLGVRPGSVTALGLINDLDRRVGFVLDRRLWEAETVNFHPLTNTATTALDQTAFRRVLVLLGRDPLVVDFEAPER